MGVCYQVTFLGNALADIIAAVERLTYWWMMDYPIFYFMHVFKNEALFSILTTTLVFFLFFKITVFIIMRSLIMLKPVRSSWVSRRYSFTNLWNVTMWWRISLYLKIFLKKNNTSLGWLLYKYFTFLFEWYLQYFYKIIFMR